MTADQRRGGLRDDLSVSHVHHPVHPIADCLVVGDKNDCLLLLPIQVTQKIHH
jgi:hypothetical protein